MGNKDVTYVYGPSQSKTNGMQMGIETKNCSSSHYILSFLLKAELSAMINKIVSWMYRHQERKCICL